MVSPYGRIARELLALLYQHMSMCLPIDLSHSIYSGCNHHSIQLERERERERERETEGERERERERERKGKRRKREEGIKD